MNIIMKILINTFENYFIKNLQLINYFMEFSLNNYFYLEFIDFFTIIFISNTNLFEI